MAETNNISGAGATEQSNNTSGAGAPEQNNSTSGAGAPEEQHDHEHHHEHHHHHHHHRSPAPIHEMHKVQRRIKHTMKHMKKWQVVTAVAAAAAFAVFAGFIVLKYQEKKRTEAEIAAWYAQNGLDGQNPGDGQDMAGYGQNGADGLADGQNGTGTKDIDYGAFANNTYSEQLALRRPQPFVNKEVLYNGKRYTRNTAVKAILLMGLDRNSDDLQQIRPELSEQGQTDMMLLIAHNTYRNTVEVLQIPRDTMAAMQAVTYEGEKISDTVEQICMAFSYADGVYKSCELSCDAVTRLLGGLSIDHYMLTDLRSINTVNDLVGGVTVTIPNDRAVWSDPAFVKGQKVTLHGDQAERFVRSRDHDDDFSALLRMDHQKIYMQAFQTQVKSCIKKDPDFLDKLFDAVESDILSDMNRKDNVKLAGSIVNTAQLQDKDFRTLPGEARMGEIYLEYIPHYADINETVLDMFYRELN